ncbi:MULTISPECIES: hypothetical protein [unclassified Kitasatospora]|uniref:hypothetical protein n=1 Tax=unclassified Kitasatospora TaxID=2633591 RepID=UPI002475F2C8|nr:hypothetical protein [Kitasatospora sp. MAP12-44]
MGVGSGYRVEVDSLRAFAGQVRGLLQEFQSTADGATTHARTGIGRGSFGTFAEATAIHDQYELMRDGLRDVLNALQEAIDEAQRKADLTAANYEDQEHRTARSLSLASDGWSVGSAPSSPPTPTPPGPAYGVGSDTGSGSGSGTGRPASPPPGTGADGNGGVVQPTW